MIKAHLQSSVEVYPKILHSLNMKKRLTCKVPWKSTQRSCIA